MAPSWDYKYKVKLASGRVLGPLNVERVRQLILKNQITGVETAREYPDGEWMDINLIGPLADLLVSKAKGTLVVGKDVAATTVRPDIPDGPTRMLTEKQPKLTVELPSPKLQTDSAAQPQNRQQGPEESEEPEEKTVVAIGHSEDAQESGSSSSDENEPTTIYRKPEENLPAESASELEPVVDSGRSSFEVAQQQTIMFEKPASQDLWTVEDAIKDPRKRAAVAKKQMKAAKGKIVASLATFAVIYLVYTMLLAGDPTPPQTRAWTAVRPTLPKIGMATKDPSRSAKMYGEAMRYYVQDTVPGYKAAVSLLDRAVQYDNTNVRALALLASSYLNLIDSSNKDENYFAVISKLIELSRAKDVDLAETVIADVEFYITVNKAEAAENRIVEYTKTQTKFGPEMFYYLALAFYHRGDAQSAVRYISQYPEDRAFSAKVFYLRGRIAEKLGDSTAAIQEYEKAIRMNPSHAKSRLAIADIQFAENDVQGAAVHIDYLVKNPRLLAPRDLARAYYLHAKLSQLYKKDEVALGDMERALHLEKENHEYLLEYYTLLARKGENTAQFRSTARMYYFLGEGEKLLKGGNFHGALTQFLMARESYDKSPLPLVKIGDMFYRMNDLGNARLNYQMAAERAPTNIDVWTKYINVLIQSYDWNAAENAMKRFRNLPVPQSAIDKAAADMYEKQGRYGEAQTFYRKAMSRDTIDSTVYIAYAKSLIETRNYKEAPFFFALALRFDPLNIDALVGTAKCIAATESIEGAIQMLEDELQKGNVARAELLAAIADFYIQKGSWESAQQYVNQAMEADPDYAYPWKLQAEIYLNDEMTDKKALDKALDAYNSYSDRNTSDPSGYLERYRIFTKKGLFDRASDELGKIFAIYPKYPNLHFYKGALYSIMGNRKLAIEEFKIELQNNPLNPTAMVALGKELLKGGDVNQAVTLFNKAMQLSPRAPEPKIEAAYANYLLKNYQGAIALYAAALQLDQGNPILYKRLAQVYRAIGDRDQEMSYYRKYLEMEPDAAEKPDIDR